MAPGFSRGGAPTPKSAIIFQFFAENCMKMKEFGPAGGRTSLPIDPGFSIRAKMKRGLEDEGAKIFENIQKWKLRKLSPSHAWAKM